MTKNCITWILAMMLLPLTGVAATANLSIEDFNIKAGETQELVISLTNPDDEITLVQFDLRLPVGLSLKQTDGEYDIDIAGRTTWRKHSLDANAQEDGTIRFLLASSSNATLSGTEGAIIKMTLVAGSDFNGGTLCLENILLVTPDEQEIKPEKIECNIEIDAPKPPEQILEEGVYYIKNVATGKYLTCGGSWGTHVMVDDLGLDIKLQKSGNGSLWKLLTGFRTDNSLDPVGALGEEGYVDNMVNTEHSIEQVGEGIYAIVAMTGKYLTVNSTSGIANFNGTSANNTKAQWEFIPVDELLAERINNLHSASINNPVDATFLIGASNFNRYDLRFDDAWTADFGTATGYIGVGHPNTENTEAFLEIFRNANYESSSPFSITQKIHFLPGRYKLTMQGFYRDGDYQVAAQNRKDGTEQIDAFLFVGYKSIPLKSIFDEAKSVSTGGWNTWTSQGYVPNTMQDAGYTFKTGAYQNEMVFDIETESDVEIGIRGLQSYNYNNWTTIDNFRLTYYGNEVSPVPDETTAKLSIEPFDIKAGETQEMVIDLTNPDDEITLVQFDLRLPVGLSLKQTDGEYDIDIAGRTTWRKHSLDANAQADGSIRFLLASSSNATLSGTEGAIIKMTLIADNSFTSGDIKLENILMVTPEEKEVTQETYIYAIGNSTPVPPTPGTAKLSIEEFTIMHGGEAEMKIDLTNPDDEITLVQFDLRLPAGLSLKQTSEVYDIDIAGIDEGTNRTTWRKHTLDANVQTDGTIRFLLASSSNATLSGTSGAIITMKLVAANSFAGGDVKLEHILMVTPDEREATQDTYTYKVETETISVPLSEGCYYVKNVATGLLINVGGNWGTHIAVDDQGLDLILEFTPDGRYCKLLSGFTTTGALGTEGYIDNTVGTDLTISQVSDGIYTIMGDNGFLLTTNAENNLVDFYGESASDPRAQWVFIELEDMEAERMARLLSATANNPVDATFLIKNANINNARDWRIAYWKLDCGSAFCNYGISDIDTEPIMEVFRYSEIQCSNAFSVSQNIRLKPGHYKLEVQGFYRDGGYNEAAQKRSNGTEKIDAYLFVDNNQQALKSIFDDAPQSREKGTSIRTVHGYIPNTMSEAGYCIKRGDYNNELYFEVDEEKYVELGIKGDESFNYNNWTAFDNFRLTYYGTEIAPQPVETTASLSIEDFAITSGGEAEVMIDLTNPDDEITLVQFDLRLPAGLSLKQTSEGYDIDIAGRTTWRKHSLDANAQTEGTVRFLLASSSNATLSGTSGAIIKMTLVADNSFESGTVKLENILLVTPDEQERKPAEAEVVVSGIADILMDSDKAMPVYSLSGQRLAAPRKGINIVGGKKVVIK